MPALINFKICDNAKECGGVAVCPTGAMTFDEEKETIVIDNDKCITCGACEPECPVGAIMVANDDEEYQKYQKQIDDDQRKIKDLFVDRYGSASLSEFFLIMNEDLEGKIKNGNITLIEVFSNDEANCLLKSIPIKDITDGIDRDVFYYKLEPNNDIKKEYNISELPSLLIFKSGKLLGKVDGYYESDQKEELESKIRKIIN